MNRSVAFVPLLAIVLGPLTVVAQTLQQSPSGVFTAGGSVYGSAVQNDGKIVIVGDFFAVNGVNRRNIARLNVDGSVDTAWNPVVAYDILSDTHVYAVAVSGNTVYVGGYFTNINGEPRNLIGAIDATTGDVNPWNPGPNDLSNSVHALAVSSDGSRVFVGGVFHSMGGAQVSNFVALSSSDGGAISGWTAGQDDYVGVLAIQNNDLYVGGSLTTINGQPAQGVAKVDAGSGQVAVWTPNPDRSVTAIIPTDTTVYLCGDFESIGGQQRMYVAAVDASTGLATSWNPNISFYPNALALSSNRLYIGGGDSIFAPQVGYLVAVDATTAATEAWNPNPDGAIDSITATGTLVIAGGTFAHIGGALTGGLGVLSPITAGSDLHQLAGYEGEVVALQTQPDGKVIVGGTFTSVNDVARNNIARLNTDGSVDLTWDPGYDSDGPITALILHDSVIYVGGSFENIGGHFRQQLAAIDLQTGIATSWQPDPDGPVTAIAPTPTQIFVAGGFQHIGNAPHNGLAAIDPTTGLSLDWDANVEGDINALASANGVLYLGGQFDEAGGQPRSNIAAVNAATAQATSWNPSISGQVNAILLSGNTVYIGGNFYQVDNVPYNALVAINASSGEPTEWSPTSGDFGITVDALALVGDDIAVGGSFQQIGGQARHNIALVDSVSAMATSWKVDVDSASGLNNEEVLAIASNATSIYVGGTFDKVNAADRASLAAVSSPDFIFQNGFESTSP